MIEKNVNSDEIGVGISCDGMIPASRALELLNLLRHSDSGEPDILEIVYDNTPHIRGNRTKYYFWKSGHCISADNWGGKEAPADASDNPAPEKFLSVDQKFDLIYIPSATPPCGDANEFLRNLESMIKPDGAVVICAGKAAILARERVKMREDLEGLGLGARATELVEIVFNTADILAQLRHYKRFASRQALVWAWRTGRERYERLKKAEEDLRVALRKIHLKKFAENAHEGFSELIYAIWLLRYDLSKYDPTSAGGQKKLARWFYEFGIREYDLDFLLEDELEIMKRKLQAMGAEQSSRKIAKILRSESKLAGQIFQHKAFSAEAALLWAWMDGKSKHKELAESENELIGTIKHLHKTEYFESGGSGYSRLIHSIWFMRQDLQKYDPATQRGRNILVEWFNIYGIREYNLDFFN